MRPISIQMADLERWKRQQQQNERRLAVIDPMGVVASLPPASLATTPLYASPSSRSRWLEAGLAVISAYLVAGLLPLTFGHHAGLPPFNRLSPVTMPRPPLPIHSPTTSEPTAAPSGSPSQPTATAVSPAMAIVPSPSPPAAAPTPRQIPRTSAPRPRPRPRPPQASAAVPQAPVAPVQQPPQAVALPLPAQGQSVIAPATVPTTSVVPASAPASTFAPAPAPAVQPPSALLQTSPADVNVALPGVQARAQLPSVSILPSEQQQASSTSASAPLLQTSGAGLDAALSVGQVDVQVPSLSLG